MPKKNEALDKKTKEELKEQILEEINTTVKPDIVNEVVFDIKKAIDSEYKNQIKNEITEDLTNDIKKNIQKEEKKLSRRKSWKIFRLYIYLLLVIACAVFLIYRLYKTDNLDVINSNITKPRVSEKTTIKPTSQIIKDLNYYMERYAYLLDNIKISNTDLVKGSVESGTIAISDKLALASALLEEEINADGSIYTINEDSMKEAYKTIFGSLDDYQTGTFSFKGLNFAYSTATSTYIAVGTIDDTMSYVNNIIINIYEENDVIVFETKAYVIKNDYVYSASNTNYRLMKATDDLDISKVQNRLATVEYRFVNVDNQYRLLSISKK